MTLEQLEVVINANARQFNTQVAQVQNQVNSMANHVNNSVNRMSGTFDRLGKMLASVFAIGAITKFTKSCLDLGSNLAEVQNVVDVTYGNMSSKVNEFAKNAWKTVGLSETMAKQYMGNFGAMSKSMGFTVDEAEKMSETLTNLSGDVASFYNISQNEAYTKLKSVFTGETESLKELGVVMTQENLNQYALANGYGKTTDAMNQQEKVALRLAYVTQTLSAANGDFARTSNSWANQVRLLSLQYQSLKASIGQGLIAVLTPVINVINIIMGKLVAMANTFNSVLSAIGFTISGGSGGSGGGAAGAIDFGGATSGIDNATDSMSNLGGATDGVGKSADKAKKKLEALMGIDEINKMKSNDDDSDGGSGGGSSGGGGIGSIASPAIDTSATEDSLSALNDKVNKILAELLSPLKKAWDNYGEWFLSKWDYFKRAFGYSCDELKNFLVSVWNHGGKEFVQHMAEIGIVIAGVALQIGGDILVALGNLWRHLNPDNNPYTRKFIDAMNSLAIAVRDFIISAGNWFGKFLDLGGQAFINVIGDIVMLVGTILAEVMADAINFITAFMNSWAGSVIIGTVAMTLDIVAGAIKAVLIVIEKCHKVLEVFLVLWAAWKFSSVIAGIGDVTTKLGSLAYSLLGVVANVDHNNRMFIKWIQEGIDKAVLACRNLGIALLSPIKTLKSFGETIYLSLLYLKDWIVAIGKNAIKALKSFGENIYLGLLYLKDWTVEMGVKAIASLKKFLVSIGTSTAGLIGLTTAEGTATTGAVALGLALDALGIGLIIAAISGLVVAVKKIGDKCGWWKSIMEALAPVIDWVKEKVGWLWDKIAGFFGWDTEPEVKENIEEIGTTAEETAKTTDDAFGTATSNVNKYLDDIHFNATRLAQEVDEATKTATEKFSMLSQSAQDYLDAVATHNQDKLNEMGDNQSIYNEEVKAMYADLTEAEKNEFMKKYGIIQGINEDMLNYEGLKYDDRVARHAAYLSTIENDESLSYQDKKTKMDQANADFQAGIDSEVQKYQESIESKQKALDELLATHGNTTGQGKIYEQELRDAIDGDRAHIEEITQSSYDAQVTTVEGATDAMAQANADTATAQEDAYKNVATTAEESMATVNKSIDGARENIQTFTSEATTLATQLKNSFNGVGAKISSEFTMASSSISATLNKIRSIVESTTSDIRSSIASAFSNISSIISSNMNQCSNIIRSSFSNMSSMVRDSLNGINQTTSSTLRNMVLIYNSAAININNITSNLGSNMANKFNTINSIASSTFERIRDNMSRNIEIARYNISNHLNSIAYMFNNFDATLKVKIPHFYMTGNFNAETKEVPKVGVNYFAKGGVVDRATLGIFGEEGKEAIVPLQNNTEWMDTLKGIMGAAFIQAMQTNNSNSSNSMDGDLNLFIDGSVIGKVALKQLRKMQRQGNITLIPG
ncbi:hypothetical protein [Clostridium sp. UBA1056]|uniref:hypothetical protein n=1 Tax=unclassified Clostridium TaxID=2614128 RepID=UPI003216E57C